MWEEVTVPAVRDGEQVVCVLRFVSNSASIVEVWVSDELLVRREGPDLFEALVSVRRALELRQLVLACNGARIDVYPSPMLRQAVAGRRAYVLTMPRSRSKPAAVDIFAPAPEGSILATVDEQRAWFDNWAQSELE